MTQVIFVMLLLWVPIEFARLTFGYSGNINETFPELIAFLIFTVFFVVPLSVIPLFQKVKYPHEDLTIYFNLAFIACEFVVGCIIMYRFMQTQSAAFFLRTAPIIDKTFAKKYSGT